MSFVIFKAPPVITEFSPDDGDAAQKFLDELLNGSIASNLKSMLLRDFDSIFDSLLQDWETTYSEAIQSYQLLSKILGAVMQNSSTYKKMEKNYSPIFEANFRYSLGVLFNIVQTFYISIKAQDIPKEAISEDLVQKVKEEYSDYIRISDADLPDASEIFNSEDEFFGLLAMILLAFNFGSFAALVITAVMIAESEAALSQTQIEEMETTLRDWTQEFTAQATLILRKSVSPQSMFSLSGVQPDEEDYQILDDELGQSSENRE